MVERSFSAPPPEENDELSEAVLSREDPGAVARTVLYLSWVRSLGVVSRALAERFPDPESWERQMADPEFHEEIEAFNEVVADVRSIAVSGGHVDMQVLEQVGGANLDRALESLELTSQRLGMDPDDLLVVLVHA